MASSRKVTNAVILSFLIAIGVMLVTVEPLRHHAGALLWGSRQDTTKEKQQQQQQQEVDPAFEALKREVAVNVTGKLDPQKVVFSTFRNYGLGSEVLQMIAQKIILNEYGYHYVIDDWHRKHMAYYWGGDMETLFTGIWNATTLLAMNESTFVKEYGTPTRIKSTQLTEPGPQVVRATDNTDSKIRKLFLTKYGRGEMAYSRMAVEACANLQFTKHAKEALLPLTSKVPDLKKSHSVAFHVRRGDKLKQEAGLHPGSVYVDKALSVLNQTGIRSHLDNCFIASDDYNAVLEIEEALTQRNVRCAVHTLTDSAEKGYNQAYLNTARGSSKIRQEQEFMAELSLMVDATYFIGAFESNVGGLVGIMRKCVHNTAPHNAHSYGIDQDKWYFRDQ